MTVALLKRRGKYYGQPDPAARLAKAYQERAEFFSLMNGEVFAQDIAKGNNLSPQSGAPTSVITPWGRSLNFDRSTSQLRSDRLIPILPTFTIMAWVRPTGTLNAGYTRVLDTTYNSGFFLGSNTGTKYAFIVNNSSLEGCIGGQQVTGQRDFLCGVFDGSNRILYVNGVQVASASATAPTAASYLYVGYAPGSFVWEGDIDTVGIFRDAFDADTIWQIYQDSFSIFESPQRNIGLSFTSGGAVTLTGQAIASASGTLSPKTDKPLSGQSVTVASGLLAPALSKALTGQSAATNAGTLSPALAKALTGQVVATATGLLVPSVSIPLTGQAVTTATGNLGVSGATSVPLTGQQVTTAQGTLTPSSSSAVAVTGQSVSTALGTLSPSVTVPLQGQSITTGTGSLKAATSVALSGQGVNVSTGNLLIAGDVTVPLTGVSVGVSQGSLSVGTESHGGHYAGVGYHRKPNPRKHEKDDEIRQALLKEIEGEQEEIVQSAAPVEVKRQAAAIVKPYVAEAESSDIATLQQDLARVKRLLAEWQTEVQRGIDEDEELLFMFH